MSVCDYIGDPALKSVLGCGGGSAIDSAHPLVTQDQAAALARASNGNPVLYASALNQAQSDQEEVQRQNDQTGWCDYTLGACDKVSSVAADIVGSAKSAVATIGLVQIGLVAVAGFAIYKILSSDTARQNLVEIVKAK